MDTTRTWTTLTPLDGSVGGWLTGQVTGGDFWSVAGFVGPAWPAYAVVHHAPHDDFDGSTSDEDLPVDEVTAALRDVLARHTRSERLVVGLWEGISSGLFGPGGWSEEVRRTNRMMRLQRPTVLFDGVLDDVRPLPERPVHDGGVGWIPDVAWPLDKAWVLGGDTDLWVNLVGGTEALVADLLADDRLRGDRVAADDRVEESWVPVGERD